MPWSSLDSLSAVKEINQWTSTVSCSNFSIVCQFFSRKIRSASSPVIIIFIFHYLSHNFKSKWRKHFHSNSINDAPMFAITTAFAPAEDKTSWQRHTASSASFLCMRGLTRGSKWMWQRNWNWRHVILWQQPGTSWYKTSTAFTWRVNRVSVVLVLFNLTICYFLNRMKKLREH